MDSTMIDVNPGCYESSNERIQTRRDNHRRASYRKELVRGKGK